MQLHIGYQQVYECLQPTPMLLMLQVHPSRVADLIIPDSVVTNPTVPIENFQDNFGNRCSRIIAPPGEIQISSDAVIYDTGEPDATMTTAPQTPVQKLPTETLPFLMGSRYCETDRLHQTAWSLFDQSPAGWGRVQAICDFVNQYVVFGYEHARDTKTAWETFIERNGVCRDYTHLAIAFCRCMNIPARYCTGYLGDVGTPPPYEPSDFAAWFEVYLDGRWYTFDARYNVPRIGRVLIARGHDASDVAISTSFGMNRLKSFKTWTDEIAEEVELTLNPDRLRTIKTAGVARSVP
jgi:transglutaminase-like putative cysteine protease